LNFNWLNGEWPREQLVRFWLQSNLESEPSCSVSQSGLRWCA